ncbi:toll/interleukin-1 receptor domain-containing protein [Vreelandella sp. V005]|uniref:toll/interleukin-1 receptor domain-containing protein n=1 Tax=Vreelandella sp. V005 TaxID=3459608 RepID=UPI00404407F8
MQYDVALSFAGEDRDYVDQVAGYLRRAGVDVFYDRYEQVDLWGRDLYEHLSDVYQNKARYTVMFISCHYAEKLWTRHERKSAQARAFRESQEYILPARFDESEVPGLVETVGYLDLKHFSPEQLSDAICEKLVRSGVELTPEPLRPAGDEAPAASPSLVTIAVRDEQDAPIPEVDVLLIASNGTYLRERTSENGTAAFEVAKRRTLTLFCAHPERPAFVSPEFDPVRDFSVTLPSIEGIGSLICIRGHNVIPGLKGSMNPIHDSSARLYVYTKNIAVDGGKRQPASFEIGKPLHFEDSGGHECFVTFVAVIADCFLVEHKKVASSAA